MNSKEAGTMSDANGAAEASPTGRAARRGRRRAHQVVPGAQGDSDGHKTTESKLDKYHHRHPKQRVLTTALFMWERVAAFSVPTQVAELERISHDVAQHLRDSNTGTRLMQRYWNAQWHRMVWREEELPEAKKYLAPTMLTHSEGKQTWKKVFVQEYPLYLKRVFRGKGVCNNAVNEAKVLFSREVLNTAMTADELRRLELTEEEARAKEQRKRGVNVEFEGTPETSASPSSVGSPHGAHASKAEREGREKGRPRAVKKLSHESYTRSDYKEDSKTGDRKGKHQKGGTRRWSKFDDFGDYDY
ncbi:hypothetical protein LSCM1_06030 [Leishmania martiniquensis]|uniref:Uncharacterized protein n=1 Tax=Leishmania martiniquensis TaxID=1580590 RepID=A0A836KMK9_9TRYP|nr:hypothetical protein LSCM1_06030 [Leishmania martiniquensis]